ERVLAEAIASNRGFVDIDAEPWSLGGRDPAISLPDRVGYQLVLHWRGHWLELEEKRVGGGHRQMKRGGGVERAAPRVGVPGAAGGGGHFDDPPGAGHAFGPARIDHDHVDRPGLDEAPIVRRVPALLARADARVHRVVKPPVALEILLD